jgi:hypothetical protein
MSQFNFDKITLDSNADKLFRLFLETLTKESLNNFSREFTINEIASYLPYPEIKKDVTINRYESYNYAMTGLFAGQSGRDYFNSVNIDLRKKLTILVNLPNRNNREWKDYGSEKVRINPKYINSDNFDKAWQELLKSINGNNEILTLSDRKVNKIEKIELDKLTITTVHGTDTISIEWIKSAWEVLNQSKTLTAADIPGSAKHRSSFILALLSKLESARFTKNPLTLYFTTLTKPEIGNVYPHSYLQQYFGVGNMGGIRYTGTANRPIQCVIITTLTHTKDNPYTDRLAGSKLIYTGEGQIGPQKMDKGNLALYNQAEQKFPLHAFEKTANDDYKYLGSMLVLETTQEVQKDREGAEREVFMFTMQLLSEGIENIESTPKPPLTNDELLAKLKLIETQFSTTTTKTERVKRSRELVQNLKELYNHTCQLCDPNGVHIPEILMANGLKYVEVHHIKGFSEATNFVSDNQNDATFIIDHYKNAIVLCVYHHKLLHNHHSKMTLDDTALSFKALDGSLIVPIILDKHLFV